MTKTQAIHNASNWRKIGEQSDAPCTYGHLGCSTSGQDKGPCMDETFHVLESLGIDPDDLATYEDRLDDCKDGSPDITF